MYILFSYVPNDFKNILLLLLYFSPCPSSEEHILSSSRAKAVHQIFPSSSNLFEFPQVGMGTSFSDPGFHIFYCAIVYAHHTAYRSCLFNSKVPSILYQKKAQKVYYNKKTLTAFQSEGSLRPMVKGPKAVFGA